MVVPRSISSLDTHRSVAVPGRLGGTRAGVLEVQHAERASTRRILSPRPGSLSRHLWVAAQHLDAEVGPLHPLHSGPVG